MKLDFLRQNEIIYFVTIESFFFIVALGPSKNISDQHHQSFYLIPSNYLDREFHTRRVISPVIMLISTCARGEGVSGGMLTRKKND